MNAVVLSLVAFIVLVAATLAANALERGFGRRDP